MQNDQKMIKEKYPILGGFLNAGFLNETQKDYYFPADFSIQFKSLGEFNFSTKKCEVEVLVRIKIFCYKFLEEEFIDKFYKSACIIWEDGTVDKLTSDNCLLAEKDLAES